MFDFIKILLACFGVAAVVFICGLAAVGSVTSLFYMLFAYPIITVTMVVIFCFCIVTGIFMWIMDRKEK